MATAVDPFAATGGGVQLAGGGWVPKNSPLAQQQQAVGGATGATTTTPGAAPIPATAGQTTAAPATTAPKPTGVDPFAAMGGGVQLPSGGWVPKNSPLNPANGAGGLSGVTGAGGSSLISQTGNLGGATATQGGAGGTIQSQFRDALLGQLNTDPNSVSLTDPDLAPQARAYADEQQRSTEKLQQDLAEQGFAGGALGTGAYDAELANAREQQGMNTAKYNADLLGNAKTQRLSNLFNALGIGKDLLTSDASLKVQQQLGQSDIDLRSQLGKQQTGLGLLQALLGDRQSNNALGLQGALGTANLNQNALLAALGLK
jgi:hypothetical protein